MTASGTGTTIYRAPEVHPRARKPDGSCIMKSGLVQSRCLQLRITCAENLSLSAPFENVPISILYEELLSGQGQISLKTTLKICWHLWKNVGMETLVQGLIFCTFAHDLKRLDLIFWWNHQLLQQVKTNDMSYKPIERMLKRCSLSLKSVQRKFIQGRAGNLPKP